MLRRRYALADWAQTLLLLCAARPCLFIDAPLTSHAAGPAPRMGPVGGGVAPTEPIEIVPGLYIGNAVHAGDADLLTRLDIGGVVNAGAVDGVPPAPGCIEGERAYAELHLVDADCEASACILDEGKVQRAIDLVDAVLAGSGGTVPGRAVLVHCVRGQSRSAAVILAYLVQAREWSLAGALHLLTRLHPRAAPNHGLMRSLIALEEETTGAPATLDRADFPKPILLQ